MQLTGKRAVITGSNSGIGLGVAEELARAGADVVLNSFTDRPEDHALADAMARVVSTFMFKPRMRFTSCEYRCDSSACAPCTLTS